jgi:hypothetical protein
LILDHWLNPLTSNPIAQMNAPIQIIGMSATNMVANPIAIRATAPIAFGQGLKDFIIKGLPQVLQ